MNAHRVFPCFPEVPTDHRVTRIYDVQADDPIYKHAAKQSPQATRQTRQATPSPFSFLLLLCGEDIKVRGLLSQEHAVEYSHVAVRVLQNVRTLHG